LYGCFTAFNFVVSFVVTALGTKTCLIAGAFTYALFVAANIHYVEGLLYASSALMGVGASVLWTAQGAYISNCAALHEQANNLPATSTLGYFNGLFFSLFQVNQLVGNLLAAILFKADVSQQTIFIVMTCICGFGVSTLFLLQNPAKALSPAQIAAAAADQTVMQHPGSPDSIYSSGTPSLSASPSGVAEGGNELALSSGDHYTVAVASEGAPRRSALSYLFEVLAALKLLLLPRMLILIPVMMFSGFSQSYFFGAFPPLIEDKATKFFVLAVTGGVDAFVSGLMGRLSDRVGRVAVLLLGFVTAGGGILFIMHWSVDQSQQYVFFLVGIVFGIADGVFNTQIYALLGSWFEGQAEMAFADFKLFQAGSTAIAFLVDHRIGFYWKSVMTGTALAAGFVFLFGYDIVCRIRGHSGSVLNGTKASAEANPLAQPLAGAAGMLESSSPPVLGGHSSLRDATATDAASLNVDSRGYQAPPM